MDRKYFKQVKLNKKLHSLSLRVVSSDCLVPIFFLAKNPKIDFTLNKQESYLTVNMSEEPFNQLYKDLSSYSQIISNYESRILNHIIQPDEIYLYILCPFWASVESQNITLEIKQDLSTNLEVDLCKF